MAPNTVGIRTEKDALTYKGDRDLDTLRIDQTGWISASFYHERCQGSQSLKLEGNGRTYDAGTPAATRKNINTADTQPHRNRYGGAILPAGDYRLTLTQTLERPKNAPPKSDEYTLVIVIDYSRPAKFGNNQMPEGVQDGGVLAHGTSKTIREWVGTARDHVIDVDDAQAFTLTRPSIVTARVTGGNAANVGFWIDTDGDGRPDRAVGSAARTPREVTSPELPAGPVWVVTSGHAGTSSDPYTLTVRADAPPPGSWTILVYMTGSNLNGDAQHDINEMEKALTALPSGVRIVVGWDQPAPLPNLYHPIFATGRGSQAAWNTYGRSVLTADTNMASIASRFDLSLGEQNTGDPTTLVDFVRWGMAQAPAQRYILQMWGHGGGFRGSQFDTESNKDALTIVEIATALGASGMPKIDVLAYDTCLMAMAEVGTAISASIAGVFVASEETVLGTGQDYTTAYSRLTATPASCTARQLADGMVQSYQKQYVRPGNFEDTLSATDTSGYNALNRALKAFVAATRTLGAPERDLLIGAASGSPQYGNHKYPEVIYSIDLKSFMTGIVNTPSLPQALRSTASNVINAVSAMVVSRTSDMRSSGGIAVYVPPVANSRFLANYPTDAAEFCRATGWDTFARWMATGNQPASSSGGTGSGGSRGLFAGSPTGIPDGVWAAYAAFWSMSMPQETTANPRRPRG